MLGNHLPECHWSINGSEGMPLCYLGVGIQLFVVVVFFFQLSVLHNGDYLDSLGASSHQRVIGD